ncbi:MAG: hypothetical protein EOO23_05180 [Comamonadaceae bacterium]|nr:MAG: hypothetical protein EOO23_05180 [Comamonadaceae bacterium]
MLTDVREIAGTPAEVERLGFDLGDVLTVVGALGTAIEAVKFAKFVVEALSQSKVKKLEIIGPNGRALIDVEGKSDEDVAMVWGEYIFLLDGQISHCGVDHFMLTRNAEGAWIIDTLTWTQRATDCEAIAAKIAAR